MSQHNNESEAIFRLASELDQETDRALAVIISAHLEYLLQRLISTTLKMPTSVHQFLFEGANAPLSTFSVKIKLVDCYGWFSSDVIRDLDLIRKIRNEFAHELIGVSFETPSVKSRCGELKTAQIDGDPGTARERYKKASIRLIVDTTVMVKAAAENQTP